MGEVIQGLMGLVYWVIRVVYWVAWIVNWVIRIGQRVIYLVADVIQGMYWWVVEGMPIKWWRVQRWISSSYEERT